MWVLLYLGAFAAVVTSIATSIGVAVIIVVALVAFLSFAWATK
jgi:hypothetical protein